MPLFSYESLEHVVRVFGLSSASALTVHCHGVIDRYPITILPSGDRSGALLVSVTRVHPSDLGLAVSLSHTFFSREDFSTGSSEFDALWSRSCAPCSVALAPKVCNGEARAALSIVAQLGSGGLCDDLVWGDANAIVWSGEEFERFIRALLRVARAADEATAQLPPPPDWQRLGVPDALDAFAREHALTYVQHPLYLAGMLGEDRFAFRAVRHYAGRRQPDPLHGASGEAGYDAQLQFAEPLRGELSLRPASALDRVQATLGVGDIETGDAAFDRAWTIQCKVEGDRGRVEATQLVRAQLNPQARALLTRMAAAGFALSLHAHGVVGRGRVSSDRRAVDDVLRSFAALRQALRGASSHGPYR